jgi:hypothetical protein
MPPYLLSSIDECATSKPKFAAGIYPLPNHGDATRSILQNVGTRPSQGLYLKI